MAAPFAPLADELAALRGRLGGSRPGLSPPVDQMGCYFLAQVGQLLRPGVVLGAARLGPAGITAASRAMAELVHGASLLHDDVVDDADTRRQQPTVYRRWGDRESVLLGDLLLANALDLL
ncbi:MAG: polyprenyl synthetase family protein, partial [Bacteroidetes bacterium]|nr:polyprenyl synthetase family protein [Bacteroidota bacterium]